MRSRLVGVLAVLPLAACGGGSEDPDLGFDPPVERLDQQQYEQLRAAVDRVADDAFAAAGTAVAGRVRAYQLVTVRCAGDPRTVGSLTVVGELTYAEPDDTVTDRSIGAAWRDLGLEPDAEGRAGAFASADLPAGLPGDLRADVGARASRDEPGSQRRVRQLFAHSPCVDLRDVEVPDEDRGDLDDQLR